jgi:hypothetical protein
MAPDQPTTFARSWHDAPTVEFGAITTVLPPARVVPSRTVRYAPRRSGLARAVAGGVCTFVALLALIVTVSIAIDMYGWWSS